MSDSLQPCGLQPGSSVYGVLQATVLEWVALPSSRRSSQPRDQTRVSCIIRFLTTKATWEAPGQPLVVINHVITYIRLWDIKAKTELFAPHPLLTKQCLARNKCLVNISE